MIDPAQGQTPLVRYSSTCGPANSRTAAAQFALLRQWVGQYEGGGWLEVTVAKAMKLLLLLSGTAPPFDLAACQAQTRRMVEILQAFSGQLALLDAQEGVGRSGPSRARSAAE